MLTDIRRHYRFSPDAAVVVDLCDECRLACLEPRQSLPDNLAGPAICYIVEGTALIAGGGGQDHASAGGLLRVEAGETVSVSNAGPTRLVAMIVRG